MNKSQQLLISTALLFFFLIFYGCSDRTVQTKNTETTTSKPAASVEQTITEHYPEETNINLPSREEVSKMPAASDTISDSSEETSQNLPDFFKKLSSKFDDVEIPVYIPTDLPGSEVISLTQLRKSKDSYSFEIIHTYKPVNPSTEVSTPVSPANIIVDMAASQEAFSAYATEKQLFANSSVTTQIDGLNVNSYGNGMEVAWSKNNWDFYTIGHGEEDGIRVAKELLKVLPQGDCLVSGAIKGKFRAAQLGNPLLCTASWTYDGRVWYTLDGRGSPEERIMMLKSLTQLTSNGQSGSDISKDNNHQKSNTAIESTYDGEWSLISRARYVQGTVLALENSPGGKCILSLKVEINFHDAADPVDNKDFPFKIGEVISFVLKDKPQIDLSKNKRVIIYQSQITTNGKDNFWGANIKYYEDKGKYFDLEGKEINLPPQDYPGGL